MSTIKTATFQSNNSSEELDDASLQAITGGLLGIGNNSALLPYLNLLGGVATLAVPTDLSTALLFV